MADEDDSAEAEDESVSQVDSVVYSEGGFKIEEWSDTGNGTVPPSSSALTVIRAGCKAWDAKLRVAHAIVVKVGFRSLDPGVLGESYSPYTYYDAKTGVVYPAALIDQLTGEDMHPGLPDIRIAYSSTFPFYLGTDGKCPSSKHDLLSIVTHEMCHGLGFSSYHYRGFSGSNPDGTWSKEGPSVFDTFLYYGGSRWPNLTPEQRKKSMTSGALYWDSPNAVKANGGSRIPMHAPSEYKSGSSVSHWSKDVAFDTFMRPSISSGEVNHPIDSRLLGAFRDMGWPMASDPPVVTTYVITYRPGSLGFGAVTTQKKAKGETVNLESALFTRSGYRQDGWALSEGGSRAYALGGTYSSDSDVTLYPTWAAVAATYVVTYRPGAYGTGDVVTRTKESGSSLTLLGALFTRSGYTQTGWSTTDGGVKTYPLYGAYSQNANLTLYPYWESKVASDFEFEIDGGEVTIVGYRGTSSAVVIPATIGGFPVRKIGEDAFLFSDIESVTVPEGVTTVESFAFGFCDRLRTVSLPSTVTRIGSYATNVGSYERYTGSAFIRTPSLTRIDVAAGNAVYASSGGVLYNRQKTHLVNYPSALNAGSSFTIPSAVREISSFAFYGAKIAAVVFPTVIETLGSYAFEYSALESADLPSSVTSVGSGVFGGCENLRKIVLRSAFQTDGADDRWGSGLSNDQIWVDPVCYAYWSGILGGDIRKIGSPDGGNADYDYEIDGGEATIIGYRGSRAEVSIPATLGGCPVRVIGSKAFKGTAVTSVVVPEGVRQIDSFAFGYCSELVSVTLPSSVREIGGYAYTDSFEAYTGAAFIGSPSVRRIDVSAANAVYASEDGILYNKARTHLVNYPPARNAGGAFVIPSRVEVVSSFAFYGSQLRMLTLSPSMTEIEMYAFENCRSLEEVELPEGILEIGDGAFEGCSSLRSIVIPEGVETIGSWTFAETGLESVELPASILEVDAAAFAFCPNVQSLVLRGRFETDGAGDKWGCNVPNESVWVEPADYDYWSGLMGPGLRKSSGEDPRPACAFALAQGWTWMSVSVEPADASFAGVFRGVAFADNDVIKSSDGSATYYGGTWYPSPTSFKLVAGRAYAVKKSTAGAATVTVSGTAAPASLAVDAGWNWIGPTAGEAVPLSELTHSGGFADNDVINSSGGSATYYGGKWYGSLQSLEPGVGYKAKFGRAGMLSEK